MERITNTHVFFYGSEFSNWHFCRFKYMGNWFASSEQAFMWKKANFFNDDLTAEELLWTTNPAQCKRLGRQVRGFNTNDWERVKVQAMTEVNLAKFEQNAHLAHMLLETGTKTLVEASPTDLSWGIGIHWGDDRCLDELNWKGLNLLGRVLMDVRKSILNKINDSIFRTEPIQQDRIGTDVNAGVTTLVKALESDAAYRESWKSSIAMAYINCEAQYKKSTMKSKWLNREDRRIIANTAADDFLNQLCLRSDKK